MSVEVRHVYAGIESLLHLCPQLAFNLGGVCVTQLFGRTGEVTFPVVEGRASALPEDPRPAVGGVLAVERQVHTEVCLGMVTGIRCRFREPGRGGDKRSGGDAS